MERALPSMSGFAGGLAMSCLLLHVAIILVASAATQPSHAQQPSFGSPAVAPSFPRYAPHRFDENYDELRDPARRSNVWDAMKHVRLGAGEAYLSLGGEQRGRFESYRFPTLGLGAAPRRTSYLLSRTLAHADLRLGSRHRAFVQLGSYHVLEAAAPLGPTQRNDLDLAQGFADVALPIGPSTGRLTLRGGRQEISFGSSRLVSVREGTNVRLAFDGVRAFWRASDATSSARVDVFAARPVVPKQHLFDDRAVGGQAFWGIYGTASAGAAIPGGRFDLYYLGYERNAARFADGAGNERRQTVGVRLFGLNEGWDWDGEAAYQFGSFGSGAIRAWTVATDAGFTFVKLPWPVRVGLRADVASGDARPNDGVLETFNPLFPKLPYFTEAAFVAPANLVDVQPNVTATPAPGVAVSIGWNLLWRHRTSDAFYRPPLMAVPGTARADRFIGQQVQLRATWQATRHVQLAAAYVRLLAASTIRQAGGRDADFATVSAAYQF